MTFLPHDFDFDAGRGMLVVGCPHCGGVLLGHAECHQSRCVALGAHHDCPECADAVKRCMPRDPFTVGDE